LFLLVGDGEMRPQVEAAVEQLGLAGQVRLLGWRGDLADIYATTDVFTLTSRNEGTPVALIEAMAAALPGVSPDVGGIRDVVPDPSLGIVVADANAVRLANAISGLLKDPQRRAAMGELARQFVLPRFDVDRLVTDVSRLYRTLLDRPIPTRRPAV
jgi:glycosyltransferase involved in cell wall biosynthesis